jgi:hypothetical protein
MYDAWSDAASLARRVARVHPFDEVAHPTRMRVVLGVLVCAACSGDGAEPRVAHYAAFTLGVAPSSMRITAQSDLSSDRHQFFLVNTEHAGDLIVVVAPGGAVFDSHAADAFTRVARAEDAVHRVGQLGAERVAAWFAALGGGKCPPPPTELPHFATTTPMPDGGLRVSYEAAGAHGVRRTCVIELAPDGALAQARVVEEPRAESPRWGGGAD